MKFTWGKVLIAAAAVVVTLSAPAWADVVVQIDKSYQRMAVSVDGSPRYNWPVSTGGGGYGTPSGVFHPQSMARMHFSRKYYNSPMPHSIFFYYGFAIHGTNDIARLGGPASHGCVRLHPSHAAALFGLVQRNGPGSTRIEINWDIRCRDGLTAARFWPTRSPRPICRSPRANRWTSCRPSRRKFRRTISADDSAPRADATPRLHRH